MSKVIQCPHCKWSFPDDACTGKEITMKEWLNREADALGLKPHTIWSRLTRKPEKYYPNLQLRRVNKRVVYVTL